MACSTIPSETAPAVATAAPLLLVAEISHRVINEYTQAIADIRLAAAAAASQEAREVLFDTAARLRNYAEAHRALQAPADRDATDLSHSLARLSQAVTQASLNPRQINLTLVCEEVLLPADRCWRATLIVAELITNAVRHGLRGGPGAIRIELRQDAKRILCTVSDTGRPTADAQATSGVGVGVIRGLAAELSGDVLWRFGPTGARARLSFPRGFSGEPA